MVQSPVARIRPKIAATVDPLLLVAMDTWIREHPGSDRSKVIDEALRLWYAREQQRAMQAQFEAPDDVDPAEWRAWQAIRRAAVGHYTAPDS